MNITRPATFSRRTFLRGAGVTLALPLLEAMTPLRAQAAAQPPRRLICINTTLGLHTPNLFPSAAGKDYALTPYLEPLADFRRDFTVFSGLSHPEVDGGHPAELCYLTSAPHPCAATDCTAHEIPSASSRSGAEISGGDSVMALPKRGAIQRKGTSSNRSLVQQSHASASISRHRPASSCRRKLLSRPIGDLQEVCVREGLEEDQPVHPRLPENRPLAHLAR